MDKRGTVNIENKVKMLGIHEEDIGLTKKQRERFHQLLEELNRSANACQIMQLELVRNQLEARGLSPSDVRDLTFALASPAHENPTNADILESDRFLLARFNAAIKLVSETASSLHDINLLDQSILLRRNLENTTIAIKKTLLSNSIEPQRMPAFRGLEQALDEETKSFLGMETERSTSDSTDNMGHVMLCIVRNTGILQDMKEMLIKLANHIGYMIKSL
ncbi:uncharacterized protein LOC116618411 isoform X3 [Nematostella vectensis]|uniref:uncharacterized protein LOC116618411 isoform X3 n=1 Tax=Nematostella vectensis TaxID=45351 RepID=UPI002076EE8D|nr:uncharacterized protein LOC116618411 isoform X3 [Nematostella vectensis]